MKSSARFNIANTLYALTGTFLGAAAVFLAVAHQRDGATAAPGAGSGDAGAAVTSRRAEATGSGAPSPALSEVTRSLTQLDTASTVDDPAPEAPTAGLAGAVAATRDTVVMLDVGGNLSGAGVVIASRGVVLTNFHVVAPLFANGGRFQGMDGALMARFRDGRTVPAEVVAADGTEDLALLQLTLEEDETVPAADMGRSESLAVGASVFAVGCPVGLEHTVSSGIVSAVDRAGVLSNPDVPVIQLGASINLGDSGGPLFSLGGELIGITTARAREAQGIAFAIPIDRIVSFLRALEAGDATRLGYVGLELRPDVEVDAALAGANFKIGVLIGEVPTGGPAALAGLDAGDVVVALRGRRFDEFGRGARARLEAARAVQKSARALLAGESLTLTVVRDGIARDVSIVAVSAEDDARAVLDLGARLLGLRFDPAATVPRVQAIDPNGPLGGQRRARMLEGARMVRLLGRPTETLDDLLALIPSLARLVDSGRGRRVQAVFELSSGQVIAAVLTLSPGV